MRYSQRAPSGVRKLWVRKNARNDRRTCAGSVASSALRASHQRPCSILPRMACWEEPGDNSILGHFRASEECHGDNLRGVTSMTDSQDAPMRQTRPMTGDEYIDSLRDDREIFLYGERVKDVTTHPAFYNPIRMTARLYDALHEPKNQGILTTPTDTGSDGFTHPFFRTPHSADDLVADQKAIAAWARMSYGWMGRSPDYKAAFLGTLGANADFYDPY